MKPYYEDDLVTIYHGDCLELLPELAFDVVVTDPPYGISLNTDFSTLTGTGKFAAGVDGKKHARVHGDDSPFDPAMFGTTPTAMFGANHYSQRLPDGVTWHVWDKREELGSNMLADCEMWVTTWMSGPTRIFRHKWLGYMRPAGRTGDSFDHPTAKPLALMRHIIDDDRTPPGIVLDPFMGSGTTLRAAKDLGRKAIGIEIDEAYCEAAAKRMGQGVLDFG
jgi:site-specific DNA-methyltransferase (adenine-specific)